MIKLIALTAVFSATLASAHPPVLVGNCQSDSAHPAYSVNLSSDGTLHATLYENIGDSGVRPIETYAVAFKPANPHKPGSSPAYVGPNFLLQLFTDGAPRPDNQKPATVKAQSKSGQKISEAMLCRFYK